MDGRPYTAQALIDLADPQAVIAELCNHMREHNADISEEGGYVLLRLSGCSARFSAEGPLTRVDVEAPDFEHLYFARMTVASHILEFAGAVAPVIVWTGDHGDVARPPNFQILTVTGRRDVTPHMRRITFHCENAARFARLDALHLNLLIQQPGLVEPQWPFVGASGLIEWERPGLKPSLRKYTVRSVDLATGQLDIDFVLHADAGPGSSFAETVTIGTEVGVLGPGGGGLADANWYLFAGDETAIPAIARMLENLPAQASGVGYLEVGSASEIQNLQKPAAVDIHWLIRSAEKPGTLLVEAVSGTSYPQGDQGIYLWAACEFAAFKTIRQLARQTWKLKPEHHLVVAYWRQGRTS
jgi:NADPH-dependent ferric siderophore reductase